MRGSVPLANPKHEAFAQHRAAGETASNAYALAGYSSHRPDRNVARMLKEHEGITDRINYLVQQQAKETSVAQQQVIEKVGIDKKWVLERLITVHERAMQGDPIRTPNGIPRRTKDGELIHGNPNLPAATKALELIGKEIGMFVTTVKTDETDPLLALLRRVSGGSLPVVQDVSDADDEDDE